MAVSHLIVLASLLTSALCAVMPEDCTNLERTYPIPNAFRIQDGSSLTSCAVRGQQCCGQSIIDLFNSALGNALGGDTLDLVSGFDGAQVAIDRLRNEIDDILLDITQNNIRPLLLSPISSPNADFIAAIGVAMSDISDALNGSAAVNLTNTFFNYFSAVSNSYFDEVVDAVSVSGISLGLNSQQTDCGVQAVFNNVYTNTDQIAELIELFHNISRAVGLIQRLPNLFHRLLASVRSFAFSETCLDVFSANFLCPLCSGQPLMCPGRCVEIVAGCISPLNQAVSQLDTSLRLTLSILKSLAGAQDAATETVDIRRIPILYDSIVANFEDTDFTSIDFATQLLTSCGVNISTLPPPTIPGKRSVPEVHNMRRKRAFTLPDVGINETIFNGLEQYFTALEGNELSSGIAEFCSPDFSINVFTLQIRVTAPNGMCSYGVGNVGTYISSFTGRDISDQVYDNPAGQYDYSSLIDQAMDQTYILTELFTDNNIPQSVFSTFLPDEMLPSTQFLTEEAPEDPNNNGTPSPGGGGGGSAESIILSKSLILLLAFIMATLLL
ncbi:uncharacterized protein [Dysidea avara]|uniref:uncharacterized protein n=1 Tax=Dysidea avara TaxID=196820 RepID=UPI00333287D0